MEETICYEALFSSTEWNAIVTGDWSLLDDDNEFGEGISSGAVAAGPGSAAREGAAVPEASVWSSVVPEAATAGDENPNGKVSSMGRSR